MNVHQREDCMRIRVENAKIIIETLESFKFVSKKMNNHSNHYDTISITSCSIAIYILYAQLWQYFVVACKDSCGLGFQILHNADFLKGVNG